MALSDLKRMRYQLVGVLQDVTNGKLGDEGKATIEQVISELKVMDEQTHSVSHEFEAVDPKEVEWHIKALKAMDTSWSQRCADDFQKLWRNIKKVDKKLKERAQ